MYVALMCVVLFFAIKAQSTFNIKAWQMAMYVMSLVFSVCFYQVLKRRLNDKIKYKSIIHIYRYVYLAVILIVSRIIMVFLLKDTTSIYLTGRDTSICGRVLDLVIKVTGEQKYAAIVLNTILVYLSSIVIKKIMLNIFENDAIATTSSMLYILSPMSLVLCLEYNPSIFNMLFILTGILLIMKIYDQIVQYGLKDKLYIYLSVIVGAVVVLDILFTGSLISWIILALSLTFIADYVDSIYVDVSKIPMLQKVFKLKKNEKLAIKKSIVVLGIVCAFGTLALIMSTIMGLNDGSIFVKDSIIQGIYNMVGKIKWQYILGSSIIILFEVMSIFMKRRSNAKVSFIQLGLIIFSVIAILYTNTSYNLCIYDALLCMACILSVGNIYYNRNEKVKLLKEKN